MFQEMTGFGGTLTDSSAYALDSNRDSAGNPILPDEPSQAALQTLFGTNTNNGIGLDFIRVPIGGNDFSQKTYSAACNQNNSRCSSANNYTDDDLPSSNPVAETEGDPSLNDFSTSVDAQYLIPTLKAALAINPNLQIIATPWSAPAWMKCVKTLFLCLPGFGKLDGGQLRQGEELNYARYLTRWVTTYVAAGIPIKYITIDNEPFNSATSPSYPVMTMSVPQQETVIKDLAQQLHGTATQIIGLDHNWTDTGDANTLLSSSAGSSLSGIAFHCYGGGNPTAQFALPPGTPIYEDECTPTGKYASNLTTNSTDWTNDLYYNTLQEVIQAVTDGPENDGFGSESVMLFDLAANQNYGPTINTYGNSGTGGCAPASSTTHNSAMSNDNCLPVVAVGPTGTAVPNVGDAILGDVSRFVQPGAHRIYSTTSQPTGRCTPPGATRPTACYLSSVAFQNSDGSIVLVVLNPMSSAEAFTISWNGQIMTANVPEQMVQTYVWN